MIEAEPGILVNVKILDEMVERKLARVESAANTIGKRYVIAAEKIPHLDRKHPLVGQIRSSSGTMWYDLKALGHSDAGLGCDCLGWKFSRKHSDKRYCRHTTAFAKYVGVEYTFS